MLYLRVQCRKMRKKYDKYFCNSKKISNFAAKNQKVKELYYGKTFQQT